MCLLIHIRADDIPKQQAGSVTKQANEAAGVHLDALRQPKSEEGSLFSLGQGCACEFLADEADWNEPFYRLDLEQVESIEKTLGIIHEASNGGKFSIHAEWVGEPAVRRLSRPRSVSFAELLKDIRQARIANGVTYNVS